MALSNMLREPRRELTESAVGIGALGAILALPGYADYQFAVWLNGPPDLVPIPIGMVLGLFAGSVLFIVGALFLGITHAFGEGICDALEDSDVRLRPLRRYP